MDRARIASPLKKRFRTSLEFKVGGRPELPQQFDGSYKKAFNEFRQKLFPILKRHEPGTNGRDTLTNDEVDYRLRLMFSKLPPEMKMKFKKRRGYYRPDWQKTTVKLE